MDSADDIKENLPMEGETQTFKTERDGRPPSFAVVQTIATIEGVEPTEVKFSLYDTVDPNALDSIFSDGETEDAVIATFYVEDYTVEIQDNGRITVEAPVHSE